VAVNERVSEREIELDRDRRGGRGGGQTIFDCALVLGAGRRLDAGDIQFRVSDFNLGQRHHCEASPVGFLVERLGGVICTANSSNWEICTK
jgi:hypothetical protein